MEHTYNVFDKYILGNICTGKCSNIEELDGCNFLDSTEGLRGSMFLRNTVALGGSMFRYNTEEQSHSNLFDYCSTLHCGSVSHYNILGTYGSA